MGAADPQRAGNQSNDIGLEQFTVPADQSVQTISGTGTVEDFVRGRGDPAGESSATRLSKVNAYLKAVDARNAAYAAIEQAKSKFGLVEDADHDPAGSLNRPFNSARVGYGLASLAASSRALVAANPASPETDKLYLLEFADALERASIAMSGGRWIDANPNPDFFSYNRIDYPDFSSAYQARIFTQSKQPSASALTPEMIEERQKIELDRQVMAGRNDALPSFVEQTYFTARAGDASLDELQRQIARGQFLDAATAAAGAAAASGSGSGGISIGLPLGGRRSTSFYPDYKRSSLLEVEPAVRNARLAYVGGTPDKFSSTGGAVVNRMRSEGLIVGEGPLLRGNPNNLQLRLEDGQLVPIDSTIDMAHKIDVVTLWNAGSHYTGAKSTHVRKFMLDADNYILQPRSINRSEGAKIRQVYRRPLMRAADRKGGDGGGR
ncbi:hypothetical protein [Sphingomonas alpina]|uniref:Uncharacterized protein n=1 Tax=Sphingomonas alpina TaxID=653931 RepID=A0A7H0LFA3_9SPHN|nr:hypothetical protein [Sphingomonas alpina]QNQ08356.1 hypothetical protein H3Z74_16590 [Sphingomonas alpina]